METLLTSIIEKLKETAKEQSSFSPPNTDEYKMEEFDYKSNNNTIYGKKYILGDVDENITLTYEIRDKNRTFQPSPDVNIVVVTWNKNSEVIKSFTDTWENKI